MVHQDFRAIGLGKNSTRAAVMDDQERYRLKAIEMRAQAKRAEIPYLQAFYEQVAEQWAHLAEKSGEGAKPPARPDAPSQIQA